MYQQLIEELWFFHTRTWRYLGEDTWRWRHTQKKTLCVGGSRRLESLPGAIREAMRYLGEDTWRWRREPCGAQLGVAEGLPSLSGNPFPL
jgi:hypothetical protein